MKRLFIIFSIAFAIIFLAQVAYDLPVVKRYIKSEIRAAKLINIITKYTIKPEGLEA